MKSTTRSDLIGLAMLAACVLAYIILDALATVYPAECKAVMEWLFIGALIFGAIALITCPRSKLQDYDYPEDASAQPGPKPRGNLLDLLGEIILGAITLAILFYVIGFFLARK